MSNRFSAIFAALVLLLPMAATAADELKTDDEKTLYALGMVISRNLTTFGLSEEELEVVERGMADGVLGKKPAVELETFGPKIQALAESRAKVVATTEKKAAEGFLADAAKEKGAKQTKSGLVYKEVKAGKGKQPSPASAVKVHYEGTLRDGTVFDSSIKRNKPAEFTLDKVIPCWTEAVQMMKVGGKAKIVCPADLAYGDQGAPPMIKPGSTLVFEVELLEIAKE